MANVVASERVQGLRLKENDKFGLFLKVHIPHIKYESSVWSRFRGHETCRLVKEILRGDVLKPKIRLSYRDGTCDHVMTCAFRSREDSLSLRASLRCIVVISHVSTLLFSVSHLRCLIFVK